jgi:hypothetical protein
MPRIPYPQAESQFKGSPISPDAVSEPYRAMGQVGEQIQKNSQRALNILDIQAEKERIASDTLQSLVLENALRKETDTIAEEYQTRTDYENFDKDLQKRLADLKTNMAPRGASKELGLSFERAFNQQSFHLSAAIRAKKYTVMEEIGRVTFNDIYDQAVKDYSDETDPQVKKAIKSELEIKGNLLSDKYVLNKLWVNERLRAFDKVADKVGADMADVAADKLIMSDPAQAFISLQDKNFLPALPPKTRQDKIEKSNAAFKVWSNEQEKKAREAQTLAHNNEEREIGNAFLEKNFAKVYTMAYSSKLLTGDEKEKWGKAAETAAKEKAEKADPDIEVAETVFTNNMMASGVDPNVIKRHIITGQSGKERKISQLSKLETKVNQEIQDGRTHAYQDIVHIIFPQSKGISMETLVQTPQQTMAIMKAQTGLDDWINAQQRAGKYPTKNEIRKEGWRLAISYTPSFKEKMEYQQQMIDRILK